jgi:hypothetical protein
LYFKEIFDEDTQSLIVETEVKITARSYLSQMRIQCLGREQSVDQAKDELTRLISAKLCGPVVEILEEAIDEVSTADEWNDPYFNAKFAAEHLLRRILGKVRSL